MIIEQISPEELKTEEQHARYALLYSQALDKNFIDTTAFDILQPAIDYYLKNGTADEKLRTLYYQGRIYQNRGEDAEALATFLKASDIEGTITDSLLHANLFFAKGLLHYNQYQVSEYVADNLRAAKIYGHIGKPQLAIKSYAFALDGEVILHDKVRADSIIMICKCLVKDCPEGEHFMYSPLLTYAINYGTDKEIATAINTLVEKGELYPSILLNMAYGYAKLGEGRAALSMLDSIEFSPEPMDSLKYLSIKSDILESLGDHKAALDCCRDYIHVWSKHNENLVSLDLLFADKKHRLEIEHLNDIQAKDRVIGIFLCGILLLAFIIGLVCHMYRMAQSKRIIAEQNIIQSRMTQDILAKEKEDAELKKRNAELEAENLRLEIAELEGECARLEKLLANQQELARPVQDIIRTRLNILNSLLAKEISFNESYAKPYKDLIKSIRGDKSEFIESTRLAFAASHPAFIKHLESHGLSEEEIGYLCLYAIGLRGKEVGEYLQQSSHYNISCAIRKKLGISEHDTNIGIYVRNLLKES